MDSDNEINILHWCVNEEEIRVLNDFKGKLIATIGSEGTAGMMLSRLAEMYQKDWHEPIHNYVFRFKQANLESLLRGLVDRVEVQRGRDNQLRVFPVNASNQQNVLNIIDETNRANRSNYRSRRMQNNIYTNRNFSHYSPLRNTVRQFRVPRNRVQRMPLIVVTNSRRITPLNRISNVPMDQPNLPTNIESWNEADREWSDITSNSTDAPEASVHAHSQEETLTAVLFSPTPNLPFTITASVHPRQNEAELVAPQAKVLDCQPFGRNRITLQRRSMGEVNTCIARIVQSEEFDPTCFNAAYFIEELFSGSLFI